MFWTLSMQPLLCNSFKISCCTIRRKQRNHQFFTLSLKSRHFTLSFKLDTTNSQSFLDRRYGKAFKMSSFLSFTTLAWKEKASSNFCNGSKLGKHGSSHQKRSKKRGYIAPSSTAVDVHKNWGSIWYDTKDVELSRRTLMCFLSARLRANGIPLH